ncbi:hypothetical protein K435DRAFT_872410 [Dendrothele bispora CBS 962.96]|uniref:Uncharacterized protein n=1 Tax=Dendrothele bispora (strain CBS 962.96) TaxID=1314807 RepID=A0A4S8L1N2_DENBC|nr:hypothetical protein K435DRAFT_872410 [Dendrothele bispora CBS 962.96]
MSFYIDGVLSGTFVKQAPGEQGYDYHVPVYVNESLSPGQHDFLLQNGHVNGTKSLVLLDSIVYSFDDGLDSTSSSSSSGSSGVTKTPSSVLNPSSSSDSTNPSPSPSSGNANSASLGKGKDGIMPLTSLVLLLALSLVDTFLFGF